jgi:hypothetical protein
VAQDQVRVGRDGEQLGRDRAPTARTGTRGAIAGEVRAQQTRVDELAREQAVEVRAPGGRDVAAATGMTSAVVLPTSSMSAFGRTAATAMALATQLAPRPRAAARAPRRRRRARPRS